jgi:hypothetical protein
MVLIKNTVWIANLEVHAALLCLTRQRALSAWDRTNRASMRAMIDRGFRTGVFRWLKLQLKFGLAFLGFSISECFFFGTCTLVKVSLNVGMKVSAQLSFLEGIH